MDGDRGLWIGGSKGLVLYSGDYGSTWSDVSVPDTSNLNVYTIAVNQAGTKLVAGISDNLGGVLKIYCSSNSGATWVTAAQVPHSWTRMTDASWVLSTIYASGASSAGGILCKSNDNGMNWVTVDINPTSILNSVYCNDVSHIWDCSNYIALTTDSVTYKNSSVVLSSYTGGNTAYAGKIIGNNTRSIWATGYSPVANLPSFIIHSTDGGINWASQTLPDGASGLWKISFPQY